MWFRTKNGLCRYDGREFKTYQSIPGDTTSLSGNEIVKLLLDSCGTLWVAASNGLNVYDYIMDCFYQPIVLPDNKKLLKKLVYVSDICEDQSGTLWLGTYSNGLFRFHPVRGHLKYV